MILRRRRLPEHLVGPHREFQALVRALERAKAALTESVPGTRLPGIPLAETLLRFEEELRTVRGGMDAWRSPELEDVWLTSSAGLEEALELGERVRLRAPEPAEFEDLVALIGDLLAPLGAFGAAAERFRTLRR